MDSQAAHEILGYEPKAAPFCDCGAAFTGGRSLGPIYHSYFAHAQALLSFAKRALDEEGEYRDTDETAVGLARAVLVLGSYPGTRGTPVGDLEALAQKTWGVGSPDWRMMPKGADKAPFWAALGRLEPAVHRGTIVAAARLAAYEVVERLAGDMAQDIALRCVLRVRLSPPPARNSPEGGPSSGLELRRAARGRNVPGMLELGRAAGPSGDGSPAALFGHLVRASSAGSTAGSPSEMAVLARARGRLLADLATPAVQEA